MPAFKFRKNFLFDFERGHKARAYKATLPGNIPMHHYQIPVPAHELAFDIVRHVLGRIQEVP